jgi:hypothetical protein
MEEKQMTSVDLRPNADLTPLQWTSTGAAHYIEIDEDVDTPSATDKLSTTVNTNVDTVALNDSPADYGSCNSVTLRVNGKASADIGFVATLRKADETILATVTFVKNVDTTQQTKTSGAQAATLTKAEVDGLKIKFTAAT